MPRPSSIPRRRPDIRRAAGRAGRALAYGVVVGALLWKGAAVTVPFLICAIGIALLSMLASLRWPAERRTGRVLAGILALGLLASAFAVLQSLVFEAPLATHPIWDETNPLLFVTGHALSVAPTATREAIPVLLAPFLMFVGCVALFPNDRHAMTLMRFLAWVGGAFAAFGILQVAVLHDSLLFFEKVHYLDSLTGVFVNRNTAGTFLAVASLVAMIVLMDALRPRAHDAVRGQAAPPFPARAVLPLALVCLPVLGLLLTKSRGALLSALLGYCIALPWLVLSHRPRAGETAGPSSRWRRWAPPVLALVLIGVVASLFGGLTAARLGPDGVDPGRICLFRAAAESFRDNWRFGTGFATFASVFPSYRSLDCAASATAFIRAHNTYLEGLAVFGIGFVPLVVGIYGVAAYVLVRGCRSRRRYRFVPILGIGIVAVVTAHGMVDFSMQIPGMAIYAAAVLAGITTIALAGRSERSGSRRGRTRTRAEEPAER